MNSTLLKQFLNFLQNPDSVSMFVKKRLFLNSLVVRYADVNHKGRGRPKHYYIPQRLYTVEQWNRFPTEVQEILTQQGTEVINAN